MAFFMFVAEVNQTRMHAYRVCERSLNAVVWSALLCALIGKLVYVALMNGHKPKKVLVTPDDWKPAFLSQALNQEEAVAPVPQRKRKIDKRKKKRVHSQQEPIMYLEEDDCSIASEVSVFHDRTLFFKVGI